MSELHAMITELLTRLPVKAAPPTTDELDALSALSTALAPVLNGTLGPWRADTEHRAADGTPNLLRRHDGRGVARLSVWQFPVSAGKALISISGIFPGSDRMTLPAAIGMDFACKLADLLARVHGFDLAADAQETP